MRVNVSRYSIVMVVHSSDLQFVKQNIPIIYHFLQPNQISIVINKSAEHEIKQMKLDYVRFIDEDRVKPGLNYKRIEEIIYRRCRNSNRTGWYFQQFLKMAYADICEDEWYLLWDADTIPLRHIKFFEEEKAVLDMKTEFNRPYFRTMKKLINLDRMVDGSFISEHMMINKKAMHDLLGRIEANERIQGTAFYEKIIYSVGIKDLNGSGFSEYETYGQFVMKNYKGMYVMRKLRTLREAKIILGDSINREIFLWAGKSYDIISFEKYHKTDPLFYRFTHSFLRYYISMGNMWAIYKRLHTGVFHE